MLARLGLLAWVLVGTLATGALGATGAAVRASHVYHLTKFVEWPEDAFPSADAPLEICAVDPSDTALRALDGRTARGRTIRVRSGVEPADSDGCQIVVFAPSLGHRTVDRVAPRGVLTIGEGERFVRDGGMVGFVDRPGGVGFAVNPESAEAAGLHVSSKLLRLSDIVEAREASAP